VVSLSLATPQFETTFAPTLTIYSAVIRPCLAYQTFARRILQHYTCTSKQFHAITLFGRKRTEAEAVVFFLGRRQLLVGLSLDDRTRPKSSAADRRIIFRRTWCSDK